MKVGTFQGEIWQEEVNGPKHSDDVNMPLTVALAPDVVDKVPQAIVSLLSSDLTTD